MKRFTVPVASLLLLATIAVGQPPHGGGRPGGPGAGGPPDPQQMLQLRIDRLTELLGLTDAQKSQAATIFGDAAQATQPLQQQMRETRTSLQEAVRANNTAQIDQLATTIGNLTGKVTAIDSKAEAQFVKILTPEQLAKYPPQGMGGPGGGFGGQRRPGPRQ